MSLDYKKNWLQHSFENDVYLKGKNWLQQSPGDDVYLDDSRALINISSTNVFRFFTSNYGPPLLNYSSDDVSKTLRNSRSHSVFVFFGKLSQDFIHSVNNLSHDLIHSVIRQAFLFPKKMIFPDDAVSIQTLPWNRRWFPPIWLSTVIVPHIKQWQLSFSYSHLTIN